MRWRTDDRWAPAAAAGAAVAVVLAVTGVTLAVSSGDEPADRTELATLAAPSAEGSPSRAAAQEPSPVATREPTAAPAPSGGDEPTSAPAQPQQAPATTTTAAPPPRPTTAPAPPRTTAPRPSPTGARAAFAFDAAYGTDEPREVVVQYGDSSSCPHTNVTHRVQESADRVVVTLEADAMDPGRACTADYRQVLVPVRLGQPLGDRELVDGSRGEPVPVDRRCQRPFANPPPPKDCEP